MSQIITWAPGMTLESAEKQIILAAYGFYRSNKTLTSNSLGIAVRTLDAKLAKYDEEQKTLNERQARDRKQQDEFLKRARGVLPNNVFNGNQPADVERHRQHVGASQPAQQGAEHSRGSGETPKETGHDVPSASPGVRVEPAAQVPAQPTVPVPERPQVQTVLPKQVSQGGQRGRR